MVVDRRSLSYKGAALVSWNKALGEALH